MKTQNRRKASPTVPRGTQTQERPALAAPAIASHTPGPWRDSHNGPDDIRIFAESVADSPRAVAKVNTPLHRQLEACANARLIAAAPEMLAFLRDGAFQLGRLTGPALETYARTFATLADSLVARAESGGKGGTEK